MRLEDVIDPARHRVRLESGYVSEDSGMVLVGGLPIPAFWMAHVSAQENEPVWVLMADRPDAPSLAVVIGANGPPVAEGSRPLYGTIAAAPLGADTVSVSTASGLIDAAFPASYEPVVSDKVRLLWQEDNAWVLGKSSKSTTPAPGKPKKPKPDTQRPPMGRGSGSDTFTASDSATWSTGTRSWNSFFKKNVYQGSYPSVGANRGAWFYHNKLSKLRGKTATKVEIWIPKRHKAGSYNAAVTVHLFLHTSSRRPGGDVNRGSSKDITVGKGHRGGWFTLPTSWGAALIGGSGVSMANGAYAGFDGVFPAPKSGQLRITWEG